MSIPSSDPARGDRPAPTRTSRRRFLLGTAAVAGTVVASGAFAVGPGSGAAEGASTALKFLRHAYSGDPSGAGTERWQVQVLQADRARPSSTQVGEQLVYATAARRASDPLGITQCVPPSAVRPEWLLQDRSGRLITRGNGDDTAIDVGHPGFQQAAAEFLLTRCRGDGTGQRWTGVQHDEANAHFGWGWDEAVPARYPTDASWQQALTEHLGQLAQRLHAEGFSLGANLGGAPASGLDFYVDLVGHGVIPTLEHFVIDGPTPAGGTPAFLPAAPWEARLGYVEAAEANRDGSPSPVTPGGLRIQVHESEESDDVVRYSLGSYLLATAGTGASAYGADVRFDGSASPYPSSYTEALRLGPPTGPRRRLQDDLWGRPFVNGGVLVNPGTSSSTYRGVLVQPQRATFVLF